MCFCLQCTISLVFAVILGWVNDRDLISRRNIMFFCIFSWTICSTLAGLSNTLGELVFWRGCVGIGTGAFNVIGPVMIADFFPVAERNYAYGFIALGIPVGAAFGFGLSAVLGEAYGWRAAFFIIGAPGILCSFMIYWCNDPQRGINDVVMDSSNANRAKVLGNEEYRNGPGDERSEFDVGSSTEIQGADKTGDGNKKLKSWQEEWEDIKEILMCPAFQYSVAGLTASNFSLAGLADWLPAFLVRYCGAELGGAGIVVGLAVVIGGIAGNLLGAKTAQYYSKKVKSAYFLIPAVYTVPAAFFLLLTINETSSLAANYFYIFLSMVFVWTFIGPLAALVIGVIRPELRSIAGGIAHLIVSLLGNIISPPIIGAVSDDSGSLRTAMQSVWITTFVSGVFWFGGYYFLPALTADITEDSSATSVSFSDFLFNGGIATTAPKAVEDLEGVKKLSADNVNPMMRDLEVADSPSAPEESSKPAVQSRPSGSRSTRREVVNMKQISEEVVSPFVQPY